MSPTPKKRASDTPGVQAAPPPLQAVVTPAPSGTVDFTDQSSFKEGVDTSPYATVKSSKRASKTPGEKGVKRAKGKVARPKSAVVVDFEPRPVRPAQPPATQAPANPSRTNLRVVPAPYPAQDASQTREAQRPDQARPNAKKSFRQPIPSYLRPETDHEPTFGTPTTAAPETPKTIDSSSFTVVASPRPSAADARPSVGTSNVARPKPSKVAEPAPQAKRPQEAGTAARRPPVIVSEEPAPKRRTATLASFLRGLVPPDREIAAGRAITTLTFLACVLFTVFTLYAPSQQLYLAVRLNERLQNELVINQERVTALEQGVEAMSTAEGYQDIAHQKWGLVLPGEIYVNVTHATQSVEESSIPPAVKRGSGTNTSTWVTDLLDGLFVGTSATSASVSVDEVATISETAQGE